MRRLADAFASDGYPTMRFSYPGTGDSCDLEATGNTPAEHWSAWQDSLQAAADWLRGATGARRLILVGLRIGATLATLASERRDDVAALVLLAPVLRGKSYIRQLCMEAQLETGVTIKPDEGLEFHELCLSADSVRLISAVDLQTSTLHAGVPVALFPQGASRLVAGCVEAWRRQGTTVECRGFDGLEPMLQQTIHGTTRMAELSDVTSWVRRTIPARPRLTEATPTGTQEPLQPLATDQPICFGAQQRLFGILCRPRHAVSDLAVIIGNTGRDPHYGVARFGVEFARALAAKGIASFRIDFAGLGDSIGPAGQEDVLGDLFETDRSADISAAIDVLEGYGYRRFAMHGLCSGAYHALHGAVADHRISALLLVNCPVFVWQAGDTVEQVARKLAAPKQYAGKLWQREFWRRLARHEVELSRILRTQAVRLHERAEHRLFMGLERIGLPPRSPARRAMATLARRRVRSLFLFAAGDPGIDAVEQACGAHGAELPRFGGTMQVVPGLDHLLSGRQMRRTAAAAMIEFLGEPAHADTSLSPAEPAARLERLAMPALT